MDTLHQHRMKLKGGGWLIIVVYLKGPQTRTMIAAYRNDRDLELMRQKWYVDLDQDQVSELTGELAVAIRAGRPKTKRNRI